MATTAGHSVFDSAVPERDEQRADDREHERAPRSRERARSHEVGHRERGERPERGDQRELRIVQDDKSQEQQERHHDRRAQPR